jgi:acyl-CoA dehydrogenase
MNLDLTPADLAFREELRAFIAANLTEEMRRGQALTPTVFPEPEISLPWQRALHAKGWAAPSWPREYGGPGWSAVQRFLFETECARAGAPVLPGLGLRMVGPVLMRYGTDAQKAHVLPRILSAEDYWCQGYSEPQSGSDLASLRTRAVAEGEDYIVTGTKIWTTHAHHANRMFALVRTSDTGKPQQGISFLLLDMASPGITIRPIRTIGGDHEVNQVFLDGVRVPQANRVGAEGEGWEVAKYLLEFERGGGVASGRLRALLERLAAMLRAQAVAPSDAAAIRLAEIAADLDALEMLELRAASAQQAGASPGNAAPVLKLRASEIRQALHEALVDALGPHALRWEPQRPLHAAQFDDAAHEAESLILAQHLNGRAGTIFGGTSEIQLGLIARQVAGA